MVGGFVHYGDKMQKLSNREADQFLKDSIQKLNESIDFLSKIAILGVNSNKYLYRGDIISNKLNELIKIRNSLEEILG